MKKLVGVNVRGIAAEVVDAVVSDGQSLDAALASNESRVVEKDGPLLRMLCYGSIRAIGKRMAISSSWMSGLGRRGMGGG